MQFQPSLERAQHPTVHSDPLTDDNSTMSEEGNVT